MLSFLWSCGIFARKIQRHRPDILSIVVPWAQPLDRRPLSGKEGMRVPQEGMIIRHGCIVEILGQVVASKQENQVVEERKRGPTERSGIDCIHSRENDARSEAGDRIEK